MAACCVKYSTWATSFDDREKRVMQITKSGDLTPAELPRAAMAPSGENSETDVPCRGVTSLLWCDPIIGWIPGLTVSLPIGDFFLFTLPTQLRRSWMRVHCAGIAGQLQLSLARHKCRLCIAMQDGAGICTRHVQCSIYAVTLRIRLVAHSPKSWFMTSLLADHEYRPINLRADLETQILDLKQGIHF